MLLWASFTHQVSCFAFRWLCVTPKWKDSPTVPDTLVPQYFSKGCNGYIQGTFSSFWKLCAPFTEVIFTIAWSSVLILSLKPCPPDHILSVTYHTAHGRAGYPHQGLSVAPQTMNAQADEQTPMSLIFSKEHVTKQTPSTWLDWEGKSASGGPVCTFDILCLFALDAAFLSLLTG